MLNVLNFKLNLSIELTANKAITVPICKIPISLEIEILHEKGKKCTEAMHILSEELKNKLTH